MSLFKPVLTGCFGIEWGIEDAESACEFIQIIQSMPAKNVFSPKQVARAIQVSEASIKRWCDKGLIRAEHTAGGHRRIALDGLLEFLRSSKRDLVRPEVLGLPATSGQTDRVIDRGAARLTEALLQGDEEQCRQITLDLYLARHSIGAICDQVFAEAFHTIGDRWECGQAEVYQERRACEIALRVLHELRALTPAPPSDAPLTIGGAPPGDPYQLATTMAELVLRDAGWTAVSLGDNLPFETFAAAIKEHRPRLFWLSCTHLNDKEDFLCGYAWLHEAFEGDVPFVVGGQALTEPLRRQMKFAAYGENMRRLVTTAHALRALVSTK